MNPSSSYKSEEDQGIWEEYSEIVKKKAVHSTRFIKNNEVYLDRKK